MLDFFGLCYLIKAALVSVNLSKVRLIWIRVHYSQSTLITVGWAGGLVQV